jgi:hypothetical protein
MDYSNRLITRLNKEKLIGMTVYTAFNNCGYNEYSRKVLLSGICKYYRRDIFDKFVWCISEMLLFGIHPNGKGLVTNVLNRLRILIMEELLFSSKVHKIVEAIQMVESIDNYNMTLDEVFRRVYSLCKILKTREKSRTVSYFRNWFRYEGEGGMQKLYEVQNYEFDQINTYKKKGDSDELLLLGENLLHVLDVLCQESKTEVTEKTMKNVICLYRLFLNKCLKAGTRYRRKKGIYLFWEIMNAYMFRISVEDPENHDLQLKWTIIYDFGLRMFFREQMAERDAFGIWMIMYCLYVRQIDWKKDTRNINENLLDIGYVYGYLKERESTEVKVDEDFVVNDWHVNREFGIDKFAKVGAYVKNEKRGFLSVDMFTKMSDFYVAKKTEVANKRKSAEKTKHKRTERIQEIRNMTENISHKPIKNNKLFRDLEFVNWDDHFSNVKIFHEGVCGGKVCCIFVDYKGNRYVLKEMKKSFNYGRDYLFIDRVKKYFGVKSMNMCRIRSNKGLVKINPKNNKYRDNCNIGDRSSDICEGGKGVVYCMMDYFVNIGNVVQNKDVRRNSMVKKELLKIRMFDGLFRSSDNIPRNILVGTDNETLLSIDEGDIYGKRKVIFNGKGDWDKNNIEIDMVDEILNEWDLKSKIPMMKKRLERFGFGIFVSEMEDRFIKYRDIILSEV